MPGLNDLHFMDWESPFGERIETPTTAHDLLSNMVMVQAKERRFNMILATAEELAEIHMKIINAPDKGRKNFFKKVMKNAKRYGHPGGAVMVDTPEPEQEKIPFVPAALLPDMHYRDDVCYDCPLMKEHGCTVIKTRPAFWGNSCPHKPLKRIRK